MPVHDWTRVNAGTFHHFHTTWITHISDALNEGRLPRGYYALTEQHAGRTITDVLTLQIGDHEPNESNGGGTAVMTKTPPRVGRKIVAGPNATHRAARRTLVIRREHGHRIVALLEIISPANKDRPSSVEQIVEKVHSALRHDLNVLLIDLYPPGPHDPEGIHRAIWADFDAPHDMPPNKPLILASYVAARLPEVHVEAIAVGDSLPEMPLFLEPRAYVDVPLEMTYQTAYRGVPAFWREVVEGLRPPTD